MIGRDKGKLSKKQIERQIHERALNTANILLTDHARKRMRERRMERYVEGRDIGVVVAFEIDAAGLPVITVMDI
ncbi:MAG TPA: hypothetical protein PLX21_14655 [Rhodocyclaceae bacterium]|nr:hypothetical protein [Rhodocyclaceae bacterium]